MRDKHEINLTDWIIYIGMIGIFLVFTVICSAMGKNFLNINNIMNIVNQASINAILAIGASIVILTGGIDLSIGSVVGFVGIFLAMNIKDGMPIPAAIILCLLCGAVIGLFNGVLVSYGKVPAFITTLGSMQAVRGLAQIINEGQAVSGFSLKIGALMKTKFYALGGNSMLRACQVSGLKNWKLSCIYSAGVRGVCRSYAAGAASICRSKCRRFL